MERENRKIQNDLIKILALIPGVTLIIAALNAQVLILAAMALYVVAVLFGIHAYKLFQQSRSVRRTLVVLLIEVALTMLSVVFSIEFTVISAILLVLIVILVFVAIAAYIRPYLD